ncbi:copper resistance CopC family protein, partial [Actinocorallia lasiicapitis]
AAAAGPAAAHAQLISATPAAGGIGPFPKEIVLTFSDDVILPKVLLTDAKGNQAPVGRVETKGNVVTLPVTSRLPPGSYTVAWRIVSADGHPVQDTYRFTVEGVQETAAPESGEDDGGRPAWLWGLIGLATLAAVGGGIAWALRSPTE